MSQAQDFQRWKDNEVTKKLFRYLKEEIDYSKSQLALTPHKASNQDELNLKIGRLQTLVALSDEDAIFQMIFRGEEETQYGKR